MTPRQKRLIVVIATLLVPLVVGVGWSTLVVLRARRDTSDLIAEARRRRPATLMVAELSHWQLDALMKVEDPAFYHHHGVDFRTPGQGLTTITQALVKWIYFHPFRPGAVNKIRQSLIARYALDPVMSKATQLELFINMVYLGSIDGTVLYGLARAAEAYYHKPVAKLEESEYLSLIAMINSPEGFHLLRRPAANAERVRRIQKLLSGEYKPKALRDIYYGPLDADTRSFLAPASYESSLY